jgi:hypothetical protein
MCRGGRKWRLHHTHCRCMGQPPPTQLWQSAGTRYMGVGRATTVTIGIVPVHLSAYLILATFFLLNWAYLCYVNSRFAACQVKLQGDMEHQQWVNRRDFVAGGSGEQNGSDEWEVDSAAVKQCSHTALALLFCLEKTGTQRLQAEPIDGDRILCVDRQDLDEYWNWNCREMRRAAQEGGDGGPTQSDLLKSKIGPGLENKCSRKPPWASSSKIIFLVRSKVFAKI